MHVLLLLAAAAGDPFLQWLDAQAQQQLDQRERIIARIQTPAAANARKAEVRAKLLKSIGGLPDYNGPLHARVTGQLQAPTHTIEKIIFESLPGFYITANLYKPNLPGRYPAILVPSGHTQEGKPEPQHLAANLAAKGYIALTYDPIGQGEREQTYLPEIGRALSGGGGNEHLELGVRSLLIGQSVARYFIHDARRAVDYLVSRPDVDAERLAVTGCSGGGAITTYAAIFDPRFKAAAPGCFISTFRMLFTGPTPDSEMSLPSFLANGLDLADLFEAAAPLPWLMMATTEDYFTPAAARPVYEEAQRFYNVLGAGDRIRYFVGNGPHGTPVESREETYRWMNRWLRGGQGSATDQPVKMFTNRELRVTRSGNVDGEPWSRKLYQIIHDEYKARRQPRPAAELVAEIGRLGVRAPAAAPAVETGGQAAGPVYRTESIRFETEPGLFITAKLYIPNAAGRKPAVVVVEEKRLRVPLYVQLSQSTAALSEALASAGQIVCELDVRDSPAANEGRPFLGNWVTNERVELIGRSLAAMRAQDILTAVSILAARPDVDPGAIRGYARGVKSFWLLLAAAVDRRLSKVWLDRAPVTFRSAYESPIATNLFDTLFPAFARHWEIADLTGVTGEQRLFRTDPTNWMNQVIDAGPGYRYRLVGEGDAPLFAEFFQTK
jgi:cephalosporin-C deacetylase-like acetyl esterase